MEAELFLHGTPKGYNYIGKSDEFSYCSTFYTRQNEDEKLVVELQKNGNKTYCYYTLTKSKDVRSIDSGPGGYIAITLRLDNYCKDTAAIYYILKAIYKKHIVGTIVQEVGATTTFLVENLSSKESEMDSMMQTLVHLLSLHISNIDFEKIRFEDIPNQRGKEQRINLLDCSHNEVLDIIKKYGKVSVSYAFPTIREMSIRMEMEDKIKQQIFKIESEQRYKEKQLEDALCKKESEIEALHKELTIKRRSKEIMDTFQHTAQQAETSVNKMVSDLHSLRIRLDDVNCKQANNNTSLKSFFLNNRLTFVALILIFITIVLQTITLLTRNTPELSSEFLKQYAIVDNGNTQHPTLKTFPEDMTNVRIDIRGFSNIRKGLVVGDEYPVAILNGHSIINLEGITWECIGGQIKPDWGSEVLLKVNKTDSLTIVCHLPNGTTIERVIKVSERELKAR